MNDLKQETMQRAFDEAELELRVKIQSAKSPDDLKQIMFAMQLKAAHTLAVLIFNSHLRSKKPLLELFNLVATNIREELKLLAEQYEKGETETFHHKYKSEGTDGTPTDGAGETGRE